MTATASPRSDNATAWTHCISSPMQRIVARAEKKTDMIWAVEQIFEYDKVSASCSLRVVAIPVLLCHF